MNDAIRDKCLDCEAALGRLLADLTDARPGSMPTLSAAKILVSMDRIAGELGNLAASVRRAKEGDRSCYRPGTFVRELAVETGQPAESGS